MKKIILLVTFSFLFLPKIFANSTTFSYTYNAKSTGEGLVYAATNDEFNPTRVTNLTNKKGSFSVTSTSSQSSAKQGFFLDAAPNQGYGFSKWRKVNASGETLSIVGTTRKSKSTETLGTTASNNVFYYEADFAPTMVSVSSDTPDKCQVFIDKEINEVGDVVTLTASTIAGCKITWKKNGTIVSNVNPLVVTVSEQAHYTASAALSNTSLSEGYYRLRNVKNEADYVKLADNWFDMTSIVGSATSVQTDLPGRITNANNVLKRDLKITQNAVTDPGSIIYINSTGNDYEYNLFVQGTSIKELSTGTHHGSNSGDIEYGGCYAKLVKAGNVYSVHAAIAMSSYDFGKFYFQDNNTHSFFIDYSDISSYSKWYVEPIDTEDNFFAPDFSNSVSANGKYYTTLRLPFNCQIPIESDLKAYSVTAYPSNTDDLATNKEYGVGDIIPAGTPVVLESPSNQPTDNKVIPSGNPSSSTSTNATNSSGQTTGITTALYNKYGRHAHDSHNDQPARGDGVGYFSVAYTGSATLYKLSVNNDGIVGFWTPVANNETIYGNQAYATQPCALFPKEIELVDFPAAQDEITYKLVDPLTVAYVDNENNVIYAKDDNGATEQAPAEGEEDFMKLHYGDNTYVGHSNWVAIEATSAPELQPAASRIEATGKVAEAMPNRRLKATKVVEIDREGDFDPNTYCLVNFMPKSSHSTTHHNFFFAEPQANEIARIIWAQWDASTSTFIVPPTSGFTGVISTVFDLYNDSDNPTSKLQDGHQYQFIGLIKKTSAKDASNLYQLYPLSGITDHDDIITGVHNILTQNEVVSQKYYNTMGIESDVPFQGVNIVVTRYTDGTQSTHKLLK